LCEAGVETILLSDERQVVEHPLAVDFDQLIEIDPPWEARGVEQIEETHLAQCFMQAIDALQSARQPMLMWCHLAGLGTVWDAPLEFRRAYWEEGDPEPPTSAEVPDRLLAEDYDPDELLGIAQSYAGQVSLLDGCLDAFLQFLDGSPIGRNTVVVLSSPRGFPLGEHRRIGPCDDALYAELVHVPLIVRLPGGVGAAGRSQALVEPADLLPTLLECCGVEERPALPTGGSLLGIVREDVAALRDRLGIVGSDPDRALRTPAWHLHTAATSELYAKPDDRWEVNDVASRCHDIVESLRVALVQYEQRLRAGESTADLPPLAEVLLSGLQ